MFGLATLVGNAYPHCKLPRFPLLVVVAAIALTSCGGGSLIEDSQSPSTGALAGLPPPSVLRGASYSPAQLIRDGSDFLEAPTALQQNVSAVDGTCRLSPNWTPAEPDFPGLAFACYAFDMSGYDRAEQISFFWGPLEPAGDPADLWVGVADYARDAWSWWPMPEFSQPQPGVLPLEFAALIDPDSKQMFVLVVASGTVDWQLETIHVGDLALVGGFVFAEDGQTPLDYAEVVLEGGKDYSVHTNSTGRWQISVGPGDYQVSARKFGWDFAPANQQLIVDVTSLELEVADFVGTEQPRYNVSGQVVDGEGAPVSWVSIEAMDLRLIFGSVITVTNPDGTWAMDLPDGNYRLLAFRQYWEFVPTPLDFTVNGGDVEIQDIVGEQSAP